MIATVVAFTISTKMVSRDPTSPGFLIRKWYTIIQVIGLDPADD
jgi:hypothetical protein